MLSFLNNAMYGWEGAGYRWTIFRTMIRWVGVALLLVALGTLMEVTKDGLLDARSRLVHRVLAPPDGTEGLLSEASPLGPPEKFKLKLNPRMTDDPSGRITCIPVISSLVIFLSRAKQVLTLLLLPDHLILEVTRVMQQQEEEQHPWSLFSWHSSKLDALSRLLVNILGASSVDSSQEHLSRGAILLVGAVVLVVVAATMATLLLAVFLLLKWRRFWKTLSANDVKSNTLMNILEHFILPMITVFNALTLGLLPEPLQRILFLLCGWLSLFLKRLVQRILGEPVVDEPEPVPEDQPTRSTMPEPALKTDDLPVNKIDYVGVFKFGTENGEAKPVLTYTSPDFDIQMVPESHQEDQDRIRVWYVFAFGPHEPPYRSGPDDIWTASGPYMGEPYLV